MYINILMAGKPQRGFQMKKNKLSVLGILAMLLALDLFFAACDIDGGEPYESPKSFPKSFKVTGIDRTDIKTIAEVNIISNEGVAQENGQVAEGLGEIVGQVLSVDLYNWTSDGGINGQPLWTGNGEWTIRLKLFDNDHYYDYFWKDGQKYDIKDAVTTLDFVDFDLVYTGEGN
jgi:hypothetical protein